MNLTDFLNHYALTENPFRGEEARLEVHRVDMIFLIRRDPLLHHEDIGTGGAGGVRHPQPAPGARPLPGGAAAGLAGAIANDLHLARGPDAERSGGAVRR